ncbi:MAG: single-stranded DNA-binding protein [Bacteroidales bacterium]|jgi:single-strand DNA-binding protein|nr:single-stranded DNA-binding protein [Bacteroidales bacterium]MCI2122248.1 single-stranded DNA-binding protein [Bacteroidales bacterium]MCI2145304.1 single-stranded DNA-binding protein [Bacteroidales bacterium]
MSLNKALLIGNVGKDPDVRHLDSGASVANFTLATTDRFKDRNGQIKEQTEWHNIVAWRQLADLAEKYIRKGSQIYVEGSIRTRQYDSNGQTKYVTEIIASGIQLLGRRGDNSAASASQGAQYQSGSSYQSQHQSQPAMQPEQQPIQPESVSSATPNPEQSEDDLPF